MLDCQDDQDGKTIAIWDIAQVWWRPPTRQPPCNYFLAVRAYMVHSSRCKRRTSREQVHIFFACKVRMLTALLCTAAAVGSTGEYYLDYKRAIAKNTKAHNKRENADVSDKIANIVEPWFYETSWGEFPGFCEFPDSPASARRLYAWSMLRI